MTALADLKLYYFLDQIRQSDMLCRFFKFFAYRRLLTRLLTRSQVKILIVKFR